MIAALVSVATVLLAAALTFAGWLTRKVVALGEGQATAAAKLVSIEGDVAAVKAEHRNNGGSTTRDAIDRIEARQVATGRALNEHLIISAADSALLAQHLTQPHRH